MATADKETDIWEIEDANPESTPFNKKSRTENAVKSSAAGMLCNIASLLLGFAFRTLFVYSLGSAYLGVDGLFTSVLAALSLAELGITGAIVYRFYEPISKSDIAKVSQIMLFFKWVYRAIASAIFVIGLALIPFLDYLIKDPGNIPPDINLAVIYFLFLVQSSSTYLFSYRLVILDADQRGYTRAVIQLVLSASRFFIQGVIIVVLRDYTLMLFFGVAATLLVNWLLSAWVTRQYPAVFSYGDMLPKEERLQVYRDTFATSCHKLGDVIHNATDSIVLSCFVGIIATGIYSNYALLISGLTTIVGKLLGGFTGSLGNAHVELSPAEYYAVYKKLSFGNFFISGLTTVCLYVLVDDFIFLWLGPDMALDKLSVGALCIFYYMVGANRVINVSFVNGTGLFVKDKLRPFIQAVINIGASILLVNAVGIAGVFLGSIISCAVTVCWREPYLIHRYVFQKPVKYYWASYALFTLFTLVTIVIISSVKACVMPALSWLSFLVEAIACASFFTVAFSLAFFWTEEYKYFKNRLGRIVS